MSGTSFASVGEKEKVEAGSVNGISFVWVEGRVGAVIGDGDWWWLY